MTALAAELPLHRRILADIEGRILSGEWAPGHRIPFETDLAREYGCSRMTVNNALTQLARGGLIERRRKSGSYVRRPHGQSAVLDIRDIRSEVEALGLPYAYALAARRRRRATRDDRRRLGLAAPGPVLELVCHHFAAGLPFCLEARLVNLDKVPAASGESFRAVAPGPWLLERVPWSAAEHTIRAVGADAAIAAALRVPPGTPCLVVERRTAADGAYLTHVRLTYPGDRHELVASFTPSQP